MNFYNTEIEQYFLSGIFSNPASLLSVDIQPEDFYHPEHAEIFSVMVKIISDKKDIRLQDFALWASGKTFADMPAYQYLSDITGLLSFQGSIQGYEDTIKEFSRKRKLFDLIRVASDKLQTHPSNEIQSMLSSGIAETIENTEIKTCQEVRNEIASDLDRPVDRHRTGLDALDAALGGGIYQGFTYGFCGQEKAGKTTLANTISFNLNCKHLYIAMEMGKKQIEQRNLARQLGFNSLKFLDDDPRGLKNTVQTAKNNNNIFYLDLPGGTIDQILFHVGTAIMKHGIRGFILDYWQLVGGKAKNDSEEKHFRDVAQALANYARKNKVWCILLAQMNKDGGLFGGNGIRKACDQLYMIEFCPNVNKNARWLRMDASRYTFKADIGSETEPSLWLENQVGPYFRSV